MPVSCAYSRMARLMTKPTGKRGIGRLFAGRGLDEVRARHHRDDAGAGDIAESEQIARPQDDFHVHGTACLFEGSNLVVEFLPPASKNVRAGDDNVNLLSPSLDGAADFRDALGQWRQSCRKPSGDCGNLHAAAFEGSSRGFDEPVIHANSRNLNVKIFHSQMLYQLGLNRLPALGAQAANALVGVVSRQSCQIHTGNCAQQPCRLPVFFHRTTRDMGLRPAFHRAGIDANLLYPIQIDRYSSIGQKRAPIQRCQGSVGISQRTVTEMLLSWSVIPGRLLCSTGI